MMIFKGSVGIGMHAYIENSEVGESLGSNTLLTPLCKHRCPIAFRIPLSNAPHLCNPLVLSAMT